MRVLSISSLDRLRQHKATEITLSFKKDVLVENIDFIDQVLMRNRISVKDILHQKQFAEDPNSIPSGCSLKLIIDNKLLKIRSDIYRYLASDDLVDSLRDNFGNTCVKISYRPQNDT